MMPNFASDEFRNIQRNIYISSHFIILLTSVYISIRIKIAHYSESI